MAGTKAGALKAKLKILEKNPNYYKEIGAKGGKNSSGYAFAHGKLDQIETGRKGGSAPRKNRG